MSSRHTVGSIGMLASLAITATGCDRGMGPGPVQPVGIRLAAATAVARSAQNTGSLEIGSVKLVLGRASLGSGDQFGCVDCQGGDNEAPVAPALFDLPLNGGSILIATDEVGPGRYTEAELSLERPSPAAVASVADWSPGATIEISGRYNGVAFRIPLSIDGSFREQLNPPVEISAATPTAETSVTITLPIASWFVENGAALDPGTAAGRAKIEANARAAMQPPESGSGERER